MWSAGLLCVLSTGGIVFGSGAWIVAAATVQGFADAAILILILALPPLLERAGRRASRHRRHVHHQL